MIKIHFRKVLSKKEVGESRRITYDEIARETKTSPKTVSQWASGKITQIHTEVLEAYCDYLECTPGDLISHDQSKGVTE